jgi:hypothetical protein
VGHTGAVLLTFVIAFQASHVPLSVTMVLSPAISAVGVVLVAFSIRWTQAFTVNILAFFFPTFDGCLLFGSPAFTADRLTEFYLLMSLGGVVGRWAFHGPSAAAVRHGVGRYLVLVHQVPAC